MYHEIKFEIRPIKVIYKIDTEGHYFLSVAFVIFRTHYFHNLKNAKLLSQEKHLKSYRPSNLSSSQCLLLMYFADKAKVLAGYYYTCLSVLVIIPFGTTQVIHNLP